jgi:hypothetical protein
MVQIKTLRETDKFTFYGVSIDNYAEDQLPFIVYETIDYDKAIQCKEALERYNINNRHQYNSSTVKNNFIRSGCNV